MAEACNEGGRSRASSNKPAIKAEIHVTVNANVKIHSLSRGTFNKGAPGQAVFKPGNYKYIMSKGSAEDRYTLSRVSREAARFHRSLNRSWIDKKQRRTDVA